MLTAFQETDSRTMDGLWDPPDYQATEEIKCGNDGCRCALGLAYVLRFTNSRTEHVDVIEEKALNEQSCIQVLRILISKADTEITELEEELMDLLSQLACTDEKFSDREPAESIHDILKSLLCPYSQKKDEQLEDNTSKVASTSSQVHADNPFGEKKQMGSSSNVSQMERSKSVIITELEKHTISQTIKTEEENANYPESTNDFGAPSFSNLHCTSPVPKYSALGLCRGSMEKMDREANKLQIEIPTMTKDILQNMTPRCNSVCQKPSLETQGKWKHHPKMIKCQTDDESIGSRSIRLEESSKEPNAKPKFISKSVFSIDNRDKSNSISLGARTRTETTYRRVVPNTSLVDSEQEAPDTQLSDHRLNIQDDSGPKQRQRFQTKLGRKYVDEGNTKKVVKQESNHEESVSLCLSLSSTKTYKRRQKLDSLLQTSSCSPCLLEGAKELCTPGIDVANPHDTSETPSLDMDDYTVDDLRAIARQRKMKGYYKLRKLELALVLGIKVTEGKRKATKRKETAPVPPTQGEP